MHAMETTLTSSSASRPSAARLLALMAAALGMTLVQLPAQAQIYLCVDANGTREFKDDEIETISTMVRRLHDITEPPESLTKAQQEALRCIAEGDRHAAAAAKLGITESAFKARLISARERLMAKTTAEALQRAKDYRLL